MVRVGEHVDSGNVTIDQTDFAGGLNHQREALAMHRRIDIRSETGAQRISL